MKWTFILLAISLFASLPAQAQGLIGMCENPEEVRSRIQQLEFNRTMLLARGLSDTKTRTIYGSVLWELSCEYEGLMQWQDAVSAQNSLDDLHLPPAAIWNCDECASRGTPEVLRLDAERISGKVDTIERLDHVRIDHELRLPKPDWGLKVMCEIEILHCAALLQSAFDLVSDLLHHYSLSKLTSSDLAH